MTRALFLWLSQRRGVRRKLETWPAARKLTRRFIAGETLEEGLAVCSRLASEGLLTAIDYLGENVETLEEASAARDEYLQVLREIQTRKLPSTISLKLTALGLDVSYRAATENLRILAQRAAETGSRVEIDMEDIRYTARTVRIAEAVGRETRSVRVALQAYLYRSPGDVDRMCGAGVMVRMCKGAYIEPPSEAIQEKSEVDRAFIELARRLLDHGVYPALATHDERMIDSVLAYARVRNLGPDRFEFEMLHGIRRDLQRRLAAEGYRVRVYVPYGGEWYRYFMRRLAERPANVWFLARNLFR
jgi:proline dehydrogenase